MGAPEVVFGEVAFGVEVVSTPEERSVGLSGRESLTTQTGMLFAWESGRAGSFWMRGMLFPLDFVWISTDCTVVDVTADVPIPGPGEPDVELTRYSSSESAAYGFEINAGEAATYGVTPGVEVRFEGAGIDDLC